MSIDSTEKRPTTTDIAASLRRLRPCPDSAFDAYLSPELRSVSARHWTPLEVVVRAVQWLRDAGVETVVDIGSGAGKFCVAAALASSGTFTGIERRPHLVLAARRLASTFGVGERARFVDGTFGEVPVPRADAYYLFNPFAENQFGTADLIDDDIQPSDDRYDAEIRTTWRFLTGLPAGTLVLTYHGYGGRFPASFESISVDYGFSGDLRLWRKRDQRPR